MVLQEPLILNKQGSNMEDNNKNDFSEFPETVPSSDNPQDFSEFDSIDNQGEESATTSQKVGAFAETAGGGLIEASGIIPGSMIGAEIGSVGGPVGAGIGLLIGGGIGGYIGYKAKGELGLRSPEQMPENVRPAAYGGQVFGQSLPFAVAPLTAARSGFRFLSTADTSLTQPSMVGRTLDEIIQAAKVRPLRFAAGEAIPMATSATASGLSESIAPGEENTRLLAEVLSPLPFQTLNMTAKTAVNKVRNMWRTMSESGRETVAAQLIQNLVDVTGENPEVMARTIREFEKQFPMINLADITPAQMTGSKSLGAIEDYLTKHSKQFGTETADKAADALDAIRIQMSLLSQTGDPEALKAAAELQQDYFKGLITARLNAAKDEASQAVAGISRIDNKELVNISKVARGAVDDAIKSARLVESELWNQIDKTVPSGFENIKLTLKQLKSELLPEVQGEKLPSIVTKFVKRVSKKGTTAGEMMQLRSELLDQARTASQAGDFNQSRILNNLAEASLDDVDQAFTQVDDAAYDTARTFSREFNDVFTRSFVGKATSKGKYGNRVAPELLLQKAMASGGDAANLKMLELEDATRFMKDKGITDDSHYQIIIDAQEDMLRVAAAESIDPLTGRVSAKKLAAFSEKNGVMLKRFPEVKASLEQAVDSEVALKELEQLSKKQISIIEKQKDFSKLVNGDPVALATKALKSPNQEKEVLSFIKTAKRLTNGMSPTEKKNVLDGAMTSFYEAIIRSSTRDVRSAGQFNRNLDMGLFKNFLFGSVTAGKTSPMEIMLKEGMVDPAQAKNIEKFLNLADNIQQSGISKTAVEFQTGVGDEVISLFAKMVGSSGAGTMINGVGGRDSLIVRGAGSKFMERIVKKLPNSSTRKIIQEAVEDPEKMALLLKKVTNPADKVAKVLKINAWFIRSGFFNIPENEAENEEMYGIDSPLQPEEIQ